MGGTLLEMVKQSASQYAEVISYIIRADVEIVDSSLKCIAKYYSNESMTGSRSTFITAICEDVLLSGRTKIIDNPRRSNTCVNCQEKFRCLKKLEICYPILIEDKTVGVVLITCNSIKQKELIVRELDVYSSFVNKMIHLLCISINDFIQNADNISMKMLMASALDYTGKGILLFNDNNVIKEYNEAASQMLNFNQEKNEYLIDISEDSSRLLKDKIYRINLRGNDYKVVGTIIRSNIVSSELKNILVFEMLNENLPLVESTVGSVIFPVSKIVGEDLAIEKIRSTIRKIALTNSTVFIFGEKGTGKELAARCIHYESNRRDRPFLVVDCQSISAELIDFEIFGSAVQEQKSGSGFPGKLELAENGVVFFRNVDALACHLLDKLINVLKTKAYKRVGSNSHLMLHCRCILSARSESIGDRKCDKLLRDFSSIPAMPLPLPNLSSRGEDIGILFHYFCEKYSRLYNKVLPPLDDELIQILSKYPWPGNVRELEACVQKWIYEVEIDKLADANELFYYLDYFSGSTGEDYEIGYIPSLREIEERYIEIAIKKYGNTTEGKKKAAKSLGIGIATLYRRLNEMEMK